MQKVFNWKIFLGIQGLCCKSKKRFYVLCGIVLGFSISSMNCSFLFAPLKDIVEKLKQRKVKFSGKDNKHLKIWFSSRIGKSFFLWISNKQKTLFILVLFPCSFDARGKSLQEAVHWQDEAVLRSKAYFYYDTIPPALKIKNVKTDDAGLYR